MPVLTSVPTLERPPVSVSLAWRRYLGAVRAATPGAYEALEQLAWERLGDELERIGRPLPRRRGG